MQEAAHCAGKRESKIAGGMLDVSFARPTTLTSRTAGPGSSAIGSRGSVQWGMAAGRLIGLACPAHSRCWPPRGSMQAAYTIWADTSTKPIGAILGAWNNLVLRLSPRRRPSHWRARIPAMCPSEACSAPRATQPPHDPSGITPSGVRVVLRMLPQVAVHNKRLQAGVDRTCI